MKLAIRPVTLDQAQTFVQDWHRHSRRAAGGVWAIALMRGDELVGVAIAGRPVNKYLQQRGYLEIIRVCVLDGVEGGCSMLYTRCKRIGQLMGYERFCSYNLPTESGSSLRAAGFEPVAAVKGRQWGCKARPRPQRVVRDRIRWEAVP